MKNELTVQYRNSTSFYSNKELLKTGSLNIWQAKIGQVVAKSVEGNKKGGNTLNASVGVIGNPEDNVKKCAPTLYINAGVVPLVVLYLP